MWVNLTRALALAGFESIRMSVSGAGNSGTYPGQTEDLYISEHAPEDIEQLAYSFDTDPKATGIIAIGLSSSGLLSIEGAARGLFSHVIAINPGLMIPPSFFPRGWRVPRRQPPWWESLKKHVRAHHLVTRTRASVLPFTHPLWGVRKVQRNADATLILTGWEDIEGAHQPPLWRFLWGRPLERSGRMRLVTVPEGDHPLMVSSDQDNLIEMIVGLVREFTEDQIDPAQHPRARVELAVGAR